MSREGVGLGLTKYSMFSSPTGQHVTRVAQRNQLALRTMPRDILAVACSSRLLEVGAASEIKNSCLA